MVWYGMVWYGIVYDTYFWKDNGHGHWWYRTVCLYCIVSYRIKLNIPLCLFNSFLNEKGYFLYLWISKSINAKKACFWRLSAICLNESADKQKNIRRPIYDVGQDLIIIARMKYLLLADGILCYNNTVKKRSPDSVFRHHSPPYITVRPILIVYTTDTYQHVYYVYHI